MSRFIYFLIIIFFVGGACTNSESTKAETDNTKTNEQPVSHPGWNLHEGDNFMISAPGGWQFDQTGRMNTEFILFAPYDSVNNFFRENINMVTEDIAGQGVDLEGYIDKSQEVLKEHMTNLGNLKVEKRRGGRYWLSYQGDQRSLRLYFTQMFTLQENVVHIVTFTTNTDSSANEAVAKKVMETFRFK